jgi:hypothetical protein
MRRPPLTRLANRRNLFSTLPIFSFNILNRNCYSTKGDFCERFCLNVRRDDSTDSCFCFADVCLSFFSVLSLLLRKYPFKIFSFVFRLFYVFSILQPFSLFFEDTFFRFEC